ncbi:ribulose-phosphate 3-epimerase [Candidatus Peregrinibacteria bacterium]|nr:ribulose-phosphate 3-epimerase [Candidatus Peregrinibacteria bacterium]
MSLLITPSILSADLTHLQEEVDFVRSADWLQVDVMDGHFVKNISFGAPVLKNLRTSLPLDIHLMVSNPADRIDEFLKLGAKNITFHAEAVTDTAARQNLMERIRAGGANVGIALNPGTSPIAIDDIVEEVDLVLIMSVEPGFGGQSFLPSVLKKVTALRKKFPELMIQMDGGIDDVTAQECVKAGADNLVSGSYIFQSANRAAAIKNLRAAGQ